MTASVVCIITFIVSALFLYNLFTKWAPSDEQFWREAIRDHPTDAKAHFFYGAALKNAGRLDEAEREFLIASRLQPRNLSANYALGEIYLAKGKRKEAMQQWTKVLQSHNRSLRRKAQEMLDKHR